MSNIVPLFNNLKSEVGLPAKIFLKTPRRSTAYDIPSYGTCWLRSDSLRDVYIYMYAAQRKSNKSLMQSPELLQPEI